MAPAGFAGAYLTRALALRRNRWQITPGWVGESGFRGGGLMAGLPRWWGRKTDEVDWQRDLAARQRAAGTQLVADPPGWSERGRRVRRISRIVSRPVVRIAAALAGGALADLQDHHHVVLSDGTIVGTSGGFLVAVTIQTLARRLLKRIELTPLEHAERGVPLIELLNELWRYEQDFLNDLPDLDEYEEWLSAATDRIGRYSPQLANEWAVPEPAFATEPDCVTAAVIRERIERTQNLHREVVNDGVALEQLAAAGFPGAELEMAGRA